MKMCHDNNIPASPVQKQQNNMWGMKTLKMCFGKSTVKQHEPIEPGNNKYLKIVYENLVIKP